MNNEKWFGIVIAVIFLIIAGSEAWSDYTRQECRKAYASSNRKADEIALICK